MFKTRAVLYASIIVLFFFTCAAFAHSVVLWAYVENGEVDSEAITQKGTKTKDATLVVIDKTGKTLLEGKTDAEGKFQFAPPVKEEMTIVMVIDDGHKTDFTLMPEDFDEQ